MTGFGRGECVVRGVRYRCECASVNRKQADIVIQLPRELVSLESVMRDEVLARVSRGRVVVTLVVETEAAMAEPKLHRELAEKVWRELEQLGRSLHMPQPPTMADVLAFPGVVESASLGLDPQVVWEDARPALQQSLDAMCRMRAEEGRALAAELTERLSTLRRYVAEIRPLAAQVPPAQRERLLSRLKVSGLEIAGDDPRLLTEIAIFAERCDISEELERLESHFNQFVQKMQAPGAMGRVLEFLVQEIFRELNTTGTKAADAAISQLVVDAKAELERIREQLSNVE